MSELQFNSIAGAVLASVLGVMAVGTVSEGVLHPHYPAKAGYLPEVQETTSGGPAGPEGTGRGGFCAGCAADFSGVIIL